MTSNRQARLMPFSLSTLFVAAVLYEANHVSCYESLDGLLTEHLSQVVLEELLLKKEYYLLQL